MKGGKGKQQRANLAEKDGAGRDRREEERRARDTRGEWRRREEREAV